MDGASAEKAGVDSWVAESLFICGLSSQASALENRDLQNGGSKNFAGLSSPARSSHMLLVETSHGASPDRE